MTGELLTFQNQITEDLFDLSICYSTAHAQRPKIDFLIMIMYKWTDAVHFVMEIQWLSNISSPKADTQSPVHSHISNVTVSNQSNFLPAAG